jgi:hypothetical protein
VNYIRNWQHPIITYSSNFLLNRFSYGRVGLAQLVIFLIVELTHTCSNPKFDMNIVFTANYFFPIDGKTLLVTDFMNLKIKPAQSFRGVHRDRLCMHVFIEVSAHMCMSNTFVLCF